MMRWMGYLLLIIPVTLWANCDLATFPWDCNLKAGLSYSKNSQMVFCDGTPVYLTLKQRKILARYNDVYMNMALRVNDEYFDGPCRLASQ